MSRNRCRLCLVQKTRPIDIFSAEGIEQNIAGVIRRHFSDAVSENDHLPKSVCRGCWTTVRDFHKFFDAVNEAQNNFLSKFVKNEDPKFSEIYCDVSEIHHEDTPIQSEFVGIVLTNDMLESSWFDNDGSEAQAGSDHCESDSVNCFVHPNENYDSRTHGCDVKFGDEFHPAATANGTVEKADDTLNADESHSDEHLMSNFIEMNCEICKIPFETLPNAVCHYRNQHNKYSLLVRCCQRRVRLSDVRGHIQYHSNPNTFKCDDCGKRFTEKKQLKSHHLIHLPKRFECDICRKKFSFRCGILAHMLTSHGSAQRQFECEICGKRFITRSRHEAHVRVVHERQDQQVCHICAKVYNSTFSLRVHLKSHSDVVEPRANCRVCGRSYKNEQYVRRHMKTAHQPSNQNLQCPKCGKVSPNRNALTKHINTVHNYTIQKCHLCGKEFKQGVALREHIATHTGENLYTCAYCPKTFKCKSNMYKHHKQLHPLQWNIDRKTGSNATK